MKPSPRTLLLVAAALLASCVMAPPRPDPELVRLQAERSRLHADPRVTTYAPGELRVADAAVDLLANEERRLDAADFSHGAYLADRHLRIAEATAQARDEEERTDALARERSQLLARVDPPRADPLPARPRTYPPITYRAANDHHARLASLQSQLGGLESRLDDRGLVLTLPDYMFENGRGEPRAATQRSLDTLADAMRTDRGTRLAVDAGGGDTLDQRRASAVRAYLATRGVDPERVNAAYATSRTAAPSDGVRIIVRIDGDARYGLSER
jgi:outer membrane protein OmpA-like peptidoglycan-associated protein